MRAERSRGRLERSASLSGDSGVHPPSASSTRASFRDHIGLAEHIHRKSFEVKEMHELLVERLRNPIKILLLIVVVVLLLLINVKARRRLEERKATRRLCSRTLR